MCTESTFGLLHEQVMFLQLRQNKLYMAKVFHPRGTVDQYVIQEHEYELAQERLQYFIH
jgi:hypothetical protein